MKKRFRMLAGPNGSGKSTLRGLLAHDYSVNFYTFLNADDIFAEVRRTGAYLFPLPIAVADYARYVSASTYGEPVKAQMLEDTEVSEESIRFLKPEAINSYTIALLTNFLQSEFIQQGRSFSQETVFSHPSKIEALKIAREAGYRTYLYFISTDEPHINAGRVAARVASGGHTVPEEKILARYSRSLANVPAAISHCSRVYFFDNSDQMKLVAEYEKVPGLRLCVPKAELPRWFANLGLK